MAGQKKLTEAQCQEVMCRNERGETVAELARSFGVSEWAVDAVFKRRGLRPKKHAGSSWLLTKHEKAEAARLYDEGTTLEELCEHFKCSMSSMSGIVRRRTVTRSGLFQPKLTDSHRREICQRYRDGASSTVIAREFDIHFSMVCLILREYRVSRRSPQEVARRYTCDHKFFSRLNAKSAYWTGFIAADGYITKNNEVRIGLHPKDRKHLKNFLTDLSADHPIRDEESGETRTSIACVCSPAMVNDLALRGIVRCKSHILKPWRAPLEMERWYWLGAFDGDGCITSSKGKWELNYVGSRSMVEGFAEFARRQCMSAATVRPMKSIWRYSVTGKAALHLAHALYTGADMALERKKLLASKMNQ